jgi:hypothetical protein
VQAYRLFDLRTLQIKGAHNPRAGYPKRRHPTRLRRNRPAQQSANYLSANLPLA